ncbi:MAG: PEP-CTERM sorting domain-containing protein [Aquabacterium sp.]|nr:PEP-CTERM sorting domain-containing protein [Aquabacterium sp.]
MSTLNDSAGNKMSTTIRKIALAVASAAMSLGVQATPTTVNFDTLWGDPLPASPAPIKLTTLSGLQFSGATAYRGSMADSQDGTEPALPTGGMVMNRAADPTANNGTPGEVTDLSISLIDPNAYFTSLIFDYAISGVTSFILWSGTSATAPVILTGGGSQMPWNTDADLSNLLTGQRVNRIEFDSNSPNLLAVDNLRFDTGTTDVGGNVPEPASYALVALALLAAGGASRRRKA